MANQTIYTVGGTVQAGGGIYIKRKADDELLELCRQGELAFILSSRQVGKSSLMTQTAEQLGKENVRSATVDLSSIGTKVTQEEWYLGILNVIATDLNLETDIFAWWAQYSGLGSAQRFFNFLRDVMLKEIKECIVLFFDEIDTTLSIPFADDFFATVRATYNARSTTPDFKRLSFVLVGVATPSDLISDEQRTPFNIGRRVELNDFTQKEAMPLAQGLGDHAEQVLAWVLEWSGGHPYLTQRLCQHVSKSQGVLDREAVAASAEELFLGEQGKQDNNLQFVRDMLVKRSPDPRGVMVTYGKIRAGKDIPDDERSIVKSHLKIAGAVKRRDEHLITRNRIYERTFDPKWVRENTPSAVPRRIMLSSLLVVMFALLIAGFFAYRNWTRSDASWAGQFESDFKNTTNPHIRLRNLAGLFGLADPQYSDQAIALFRDLEQEEKLELFTPASSQSVRKNQVIVVTGLYQSMENTEDENALLRAMKDAVRGEQSSVLYSEISHWLKGREGLNNKDFYSAEASLDLAIEDNSENPALYYDRAQVYIGLEKYSEALIDLTKLVQKDPSRSFDASSLINSNRALLLFWKVNRAEDAYADLATVAIVSESFSPVYFAQNDPQWKDEIIGFGEKTETIGYIGDALTSLAMLLSGHGFPETPVTLNEKLKSVDGFVGPALRWHSIEQIYPNVKVNAIIRSEDTSAPLETIDMSLAAGQPVIVQVDASSSPGIQTHYVLLYERRGDDYLMLDPWPYQPDITKEDFLMERYSQGLPLERAIFLAVIYELGVP